MRQNNEMVSSNIYVISIGIVGWNIHQIRDNFRSRHKNWKTDRNRFSTWRSIVLKGKQEKWAKPISIHFQWIERVWSFPSMSTINSLSGWLAHWLTDDEIGLKPIFIVFVFSLFFFITTSYSSSRDKCDEVPRFRLQWKRIDIIARESFLKMLETKISHFHFVHWMVNVFCRMRIGDFASQMKRKNGIVNVT